MNKISTFYFKKSQLMCMSVVILGAGYTQFHISYGWVGRAGFDFVDINHAKVGLISLCYNGNFRSECERDHS